MSDHETYAIRGSAPARPTCANTTGSPACKCRNCHFELPSRTVMNHTICTFQLNFPLISFIELCFLPQVPQPIRSQTVGLNFLSCSFYRILISILLQLHTILSQYIAGSDIELGTRPRDLVRHVKCIPLFRCYSACQWHYCFLTHY